MSGTSRIWSRFFVPEGSRPSPVFPTKKWRLILAMSLEGNAPDTDAIYRFSLYPHGKADRRDSIRPKVWEEGVGFGEGEGTFLQKGSLPPPIFLSQPVNGLHTSVGSRGDRAGLVQRHADPRHGFAGLVGDFDVPGFGLFGTADFNVHLCRRWGGFPASAGFLPQSLALVGRGTAYKYHTEHC